MGIFKEYDIRGIYPEEIDEAKAYELGKAIGSYFPEESIFLGYDNRKGSIAIKDYVAKGLAEAGKEVVDIGMVPVTVLAFATLKEHTPGVCITASHNPAKYTGLLLYKDGVTIMPKDVEQVYLRSKTNAANKGEIEKKDYTASYLDFITKGLSPLKLSIGVDTMGGATHALAKQVFERIGISAVMLRKQPDADFYNKTPEPNKANAAELAELVKSEGLDFGVQFDGDGDRVAFVDDQGNFVDAMGMAMLYIKHLGLRNVAATVACSRKLEIFANVTYTKVGRPHIERLMSTGKFDLGIETSMHVYFGRYFPFSDGLLGAILMAKALQNAGKSMSELVKELPKTYFGEFSIPFDSEELRNRKLEEIKKAASAYGTLDFTDGVKIMSGDGFVLIRKSNTEPLLRVYYEGEDEAELRQLEGLARKLTS